MENLGLVGFTGAGANRLFSALTGLPVPSEFDAAVGVASLPDERLDALAAMSSSKKVVQAGLELVHIALPPGSKPGEGLGAKVLGSLRNCDAILVVLRAFADGGVDADPSGDLDALELELVMADITSVEQRLDKQRRAAKSGDKDIAAEVAALERAHAALSNGTPLLRAGLSADDMARLAPVFCLTVKPTLVVLNTGEKVDDTDVSGPLAGATQVPIDIEAEIAACAPEDRAEMRDMYGVGESALSTVAHAAYHLLGRRTFLTTGEDESRAWTFRAGAKAPECAGVIHSDLQRGFIRAEVIDWQELLEIGSWDKARAAKKLRVEGKEYEVRDGDVLEIRFNVQGRGRDAMPWLVRGDDVLASAEVAVTRKLRRRGLIGRGQLDGVLVLRPCRMVHSFGMEFPIDVAFCDREGFVLHISCLRPGRVSRPVVRAYFAIEAPAGAFNRWEIGPGDIVEVKG